MLHVWFIPAAAVVVILIVTFYWVVRRQGGSGVRTPGRTVADQPGEEHDLPPV
jgi:hypothetical protein